MLRGCRSCAISERPAPSPNPKNPLSPLFPLDTSHSPVTPLFPLDTRNRGVHPSSNTSMRSISGLSPARLFPQADLHHVAVPLSSSLAVDCKLSVVRCFSPLSLIIPVHPRLSPVNPIIPVHTQKQGGGGHFSTHRQMPASITHELYYCMLHATQMQNVGAPTYPAALRASVLGNAYLPIGGLALRHARNGHPGCHSGEWRSQRNVRPHEQPEEGSLTSFPPAAGRRDDGFKSEKGDNWNRLY